MKIWTTVIIGNDSVNSFAPFTEMLTDYYNHRHFEYFSHAKRKESTGPRCYRKNKIYNNIKQNNFCPKT
jgi:hypothetical protein